MKLSEMNLLSFKLETYAARFILDLQVKCPELKDRLCIVTDLAEKTPTRFYIASPRPKDEKMRELLPFMEWVNYLKKPPEDDSMLERNGDKIKAWHTGIAFGLDMLAEDEPEKAARIRKSMRKHLKTGKTPGFSNYRTTEQTQKNIEAEVAALKQEAGVS